MVIVGVAVKNQLQVVMKNGKNLMPNFYCITRRNISYGLDNLDASESKDPHLSILVHAGSAFRHNSYGFSKNNIHTTTCEICNL